MKILFLAHCSLLFFTSLVSAQNEVRFTRLDWLTNQEAALRFTGPTGRFYRVDASNDASVWQPLITLAATNSSLVHTDAAAPFFPARYYRASAVEGTNVLSGDHLATSEGEIIFHPINHATFIMSWAGRWIYCDPVGAASRFAGWPKADLVLVTHGHSDHFSSSVIDLVRKTNGVVVVPAAQLNSLSTGARASAVVLANGGTTNLLGLRIEAVPAYNLTTTYHPKGTGNGYVLTIGGRRIYVSGDTEDVPELRALEGIDVAFLCMNLPFTMTVDQAASLVREFRPAVVFPYHFSASDLARFKRLVGLDLGIEVRLRPWY